MYFHPVGGYGVGLFKGAVRNFSDWPLLPW